MSTAFILIGLGLAFLIGIIVGIVLQSDNGPDYDE
jgi:ABC-type nitrate/sulfonate/bicarbonate transport system permease component